MIGLPRLLFQCSPVQCSPGVSKRSLEVPHLTRGNLLDDRQTDGYTDLTKKGKGRHVYLCLRLCSEGREEACDQEG